MNATTELHRMGQSLWLDNITRELLTAARCTLHRRIGRHRADLEPDDLRPCHQRKHRLRRSHPHEGGVRASPARRCSSNWRWRISPGPPICSCRSTSRPAAWTAGSRWRSRRCWRDDTAGTIAAAKATPRARASAESVHQDSRHAGGPARHRGGDLRRRAGQRHAAVLARALPRRRRGVHARHRAAHRRRPGSQRRLGGVAVRQPLGRRGQRTRCQRSLRNRLGIAIAMRTYQRLPRAARLAALAERSPRPARVRNACCGPAPAPRIRRRSDTLYVEALAAPDTVNTMPEKTLLAFADHGKSAARSRPMAATPTQPSSSSGVRVWISPSSRSACNAKARSPSSNPGTR